MFAIIWKSINHRKVASLIMLFTMAVGVAIVITVSLLYRGVSVGLETSKERLGADLVVVPGDVSMEPGLLFGGAPVNSYLSKDIVDAIRKIPHVQQATPQFFTHTLTSDCCDVGEEIRLVGYDPSSDWIISPWLKTIQKGNLADDEIIVGPKVPDVLGDQLRVLGKSFRVVSNLEYSGTSLDYSILVNLDEARRLAANSKPLGQTWQKVGEPKNLVSTVLIKLDPSADIAAISSEIQRLGYCKVIVASEVKQRISDQFTALLVLLGGIGLLTVIVSLLQLFSRFYTLTLERQAEWGLYLAIGATTRDVAALVIGEALVVILGGVAAGGVLTLPLYEGTLSVLQTYQSFPYIAPGFGYMVSTIFAVTLLYLGLGALAAWLPAYQGSHVEPTSVMTRGEFD
ncbi:ABC transporter permease [Heliophilum fasciatum]|uniref:Putative hemin transport system permease protein HrtB n=1 Tax=Heliophilum fasciatum TaxID=35700 RepID=A0A4R2RM49_9FIRM|nr:ABC transporter permease [Heliophilum fasciatum]MCW2277695.1 putative ABC transport system permease protein [Heliophilum fasciatum]TCP65042.1 putative ABC transport system permease protein [Heliophilum fasciatum]